MIELNLLQRHFKELIEALVVLLIILGFLQIQIVNQWYSFALELNSI